MFPLQSVNKLQRRESGIWCLGDSCAFSYSEGEEAENYLRDCFLEARDLGCNSISLQGKIKDWSSEYHLSPTRANLLRALELESMDQVLELGCGCGSMTRYLGEQTMSVDAVEGSPVRAELAGLRCRDLENVQIVCANFNELQLPDKQYDAVFLIGVLEYGSKFFLKQKTDQESVVAILEKARASLRPGGVVVVAIENRLGLKYWLGAGEDHYCRPGIGLFGYPMDEGIRTYDKREWETLLARVDLGHHRFLYPFPDYKLPRVILADSFIENDPHSHSLLYRVSARDYCSDWQPEDDEFLYYKGLRQSGYLGEFANSFLLLISESSSRLNALAPFDFIHFSSERRKLGFRTVTRKSIGLDKVEKRKITSERDDNESGEISQHITSRSRYIQGPLLSTLWIESLYKNDEGCSFYKQLADYYQILSEQFALQKDHGDLLDLLPSNIVVDEDNNYRIIDAEWRYKGSLTAEFVFFRALLWFVHHNKKSCAESRFLGNLQTVGEVVTAGFESLSIPLQEHLLTFFKREEKIHAAVVFSEKQIDIQVLWEMSLQVSIQEAVPVAVGEDFAPDLEPQSFVPKNIPGKFYSFLKRYGKSIKKYLTSKDYRCIHRSGLFDARHYLSIVPGLNPFYTDPLIHYLEVGRQAGLSPCLLFDPDYYQEEYQDSIPGFEKQNGFLHYIEEGWKKGFNPSLLFSTSSYLEAYPDVVEKGQNPLSHYLNRGCWEGKNPNLLFDSAYYLRENRDVALEKINPLAHYFFYGNIENRSPYPLFDMEYYLEDNPVVEKEWAVPVMHYVQYGAYADRSPNRFFDPKFYRQTYPEADQPGIKLFLHYVNEGSNKGYRPNRLFDPEYYAQTYPDFREAFSLPLEHYQKIGVRMGNYPCREVAELERKPVISIITPVYNTDELLLRKCIHSVLFQAYPHWELCFADDGSTEPHVRKILEEYGEKDQRIKIQFLEQNQGISGASNAAAALATGEYIGFLDHDDELTLDALYEVARTINRHDPDTIYSDEDLVNRESRYLHTFYKPDYNRELLFSHNYITHFFVTKKAVFKQTSGFFSQYNGAQDFDLALKLTEKSKKIVHIPKVLYHWRAFEGSTSLDHSGKEYADEAGRLALSAMIARRTLAAEAEKTEQKYYYRIKRTLIGQPLVTIVVYSLDNEREVAVYIRQLFEKCTYPQVEIVTLISDQETAGTNSDLVEMADGEFRSRLRVRTYSGKISEAAWKNRAAALARGEHIVFLDGDVDIQSPQWIESLLEYSQQDDIGVTGGAVDMPRIEELSSGVLPDLTNQNCSYYASFLQTASVHLNGRHCPQNVFAVMDSLFMVQRKLFGETGGFDEKETPHCFHGLDLCLRLRQKGLENVFTPYCRAKSSGKIIRLRSSHLEQEQAELEKKKFQEKWRDILIPGDPYYNRGVLLENEIPIPQFQAWYSGIEPTRSETNVE